LNRGGRWKNWDDAVTKGEGMLGKKYGKQLNLYAETVAKAKHSLTGKHFSGIATYRTPVDAAGNAAMDNDLPLQLITYKEILGGQSRTLPGNYWLSSILPENFILISAETAKSMGFKDGDKARIVSQSSPDGKWHLPNRPTVDMIGKIKSVEGMRPGTIAVSWSFGHWGYGAADAVIGGTTVAGDKRRTTGLCPNAAMKIDPVLKNSCMSDPIGGSASFYETRVNLVKA